MAFFGAGTRCQESTVITFEWDLMGLKEIFESSREDEKSPLIASSPFGGGKWQLHFYASAAKAASCSLYLAAIPTPEELRFGGQACLSQGGWPREGSHWSRRGPFKFTFEIRSLDGTVPIVARGPHEPMTRKEFNNSVSTWGYPLYVAASEIRDRPVVKANNGVKIICTMTYPLGPVPTPNPHPTPVARDVPMDVLDTLAEMFDDPAHSDVMFKFPSRKRSSNGAPSYRTIYANKKVLSRRSEYFKSLFNGGFAESSPVGICGGLINRVQPPSNTLSSRHPKPMLAMTEPEFDIDDDDSDADSDYDECEVSMEMDSDVDSFGNNSPLDSLEELHVLKALDGHRFPLSHSEQIRPMTPESAPSDGEDEYMNVKSYHTQNNLRSTHETRLEPTMQTIVVRDAAYLTYRALLFALYTDQMTFAPLTSTFINDRSSAFKNDFDFPYTTRQQYVRSRIPTPRTDAERNAPFPCSPKSLYRLADKLDLQGIKHRAFVALRDSFTPRNIATELFGPFSSLFPDVRKAQTEYLLAHWDEVSRSDAMMYDMNPFNFSSGNRHSATPTSLCHPKTFARTSNANSELFVYLLQALRPKSRREYTHGQTPYTAHGKNFGTMGQGDFMDPSAHPLMSARPDFHQG